MRSSLLRQFSKLNNKERLELAIHSLIEQGKEEGLLDHPLAMMIRSIIDFRDTKVREVMIPRTEIVAVSADATIEEIIQTIIGHGHTRLPVYKDHIDNIIGILNVKDLLRFWSTPIKEEDILANISKPFYIPETKNTYILLQELKQKRYHMAIVIDEYGGTSGLVTLEDLLEEIVGELSDEHDINDGEVTDQGNGTYLVDSRLDIEKVEELLGVDFPRGKYETLSGFILGEIKRIPSAGERIDLDIVDVTIDGADERSIKKVLIRKKRP